MGLRAYRRRLTLLVLLLLAVLLVHPSLLQGQSSPASIDPILSVILHRDREARRAGTSYNLIEFADVIGVRLGDTPILQGPREQPSLRQHGRADRVEVFVLLDREDPALVQSLRDAGLRVGTVVGRIVTGWVTPSALEVLQTLPGVKHIGASYRLEPLQLQRAGRRSLRAQHDVSVPDTGADDLHSQGITGQNVIVGIVDTGIDFCHRDFRTGGGSEMESRILYIWDQVTTSGPGSPPAGFGYGREWTRSQIEADLSSCPSPTTVTQIDDDGHGTHVAGSSAGDGSTLPGNTYRGMAPDADIIAVKTDFTGSGILDAVDYIFQRADALGRPAVVNLSLGGHFDPHDGTGMLDQGLDALLGPESSPIRGRAIVAAAGNEGDGDFHAQVTLGSGGSADITFDQPAGFEDQGTAYFDFWYTGSADFCMTVITPNGYSVGPVCAGQTKDWTVDADADTPDGGVVLYNSPSGPNPSNGDREIFFTVDGSSFGASPVAPGTWTLRVTAASGSGRIDGWVAAFMINEFNPPYGDNSMTVGSPGTANRVITVGAYTTKTSWTDKCGNSQNTSQTLQDIATFSSRGPTRDGRTKPDISAPGTMIASVLSKDVPGTSCPNGDVVFLVITPDDTYWVLQGTSMATPHTTGAVALLFQQDPNLGWNEIKNILQADARTDAFTGSTPNNTWGAGKLLVTALAPPDTPAVFTVGQDGTVRADRAFFCGLAQNCFNTGLGADLAERIDVTEPVEPGDVVEIDPHHPGKYRKARGPFSPRVAGVIATSPGITLANEPQEQQDWVEHLQVLRMLRGSGLRPLLTSWAGGGGGGIVNLRGLLSAEPSSGPQAGSGGREVKVVRGAVTIGALLQGEAWQLVWERALSRPPGRPLLALMGRVWVKATAENGPIAPGDLLTTASKPGYVMRCPAVEACPNALVGKALTALKEGEGLIEVLVLR